MAHSDFIAFVVEQMRAASGMAVRARRMFGGHGLFDGELIFAIVIGDVLYLKTDPVSRPDFAAQGLQPFSYTARGRTVVTSYHEPPPEVFEQQAVMRTWMRKALDAALRTHAPSPSRRVRQPASRGTVAKTRSRPAAKKTATRRR